MEITLLHPPRSGNGDYDAHRLEKFNLATANKDIIILYLPMPDWLGFFGSHPGI